MTFDGKLFAAARAEHAAKLSTHQDSLDGKRRQIYRKDPELRTLDRAIRQTILDVIGQAMASRGEPIDLSHLQAKNQQLQAERAAKLQALGFAPDALDELPLCNRCNDTTRVNAEVCSCLLDIYTRHQTKELSQLLNLGNENFETFSLAYYDGRKIDPKAGTTAQQNMEEILDICKTFAGEFGKHTQNLLFTGGTGLGKTFLSSCIAKTVSEHGFSVVYDTAAAMFAAFEAKRFGKGDPEQLERECNRFFGADLLIIDDLGTEMGTPFEHSALYTLINTRLVHQKQTVISTNFSLDKLRELYSSQVYSRLMGNYVEMTFFGEDIRQMKRG